MNEGLKDSESVQEDRNRERRNSAGGGGRGPEASGGLILWIQHTHTVALLCRRRMVDALAESFCFFSALC